MNCRSPGDHSLVLCIKQSDLKIPLFCGSGASRDFSAVFDFDRIEPSTQGEGREVDDKFRIKEVVCFVKEHAEAERLWGRTSKHPKHHALKMNGNGR